MELGIKKLNAGSIVFGLIALAVIGFITADIVINVQDTDALSGSLQSHLYCGNVCIFGEWLNYSPFINNGVYYIKTSMDGIAEHLKDVLRDFSKYKTLSAGNHDIIGRLFTWEATIGKQTAVYGE